MDKFNETPNSNVAKTHANKLPGEIVGRFLQNLSVGDRLKSERVSPRWKHSLEKWGWAGLRTLNKEIVFQGANEQEIARFWESPLDESDCHFVSLLKSVGPWLRELDLMRSFERENIERFLPQIGASFSALKNLERLDIRELNLFDFFDHLPSTLRELKTSIEMSMSMENFQTLSIRCPNLEEIPLQNMEDGPNLGFVIELIGKFPRQKRLFPIEKHFPPSQEKPGALASIGQLKELEMLYLLDSDGALDGESLEAIVRGCQNLQSIGFNTSQLTENALFHLEKMPHLNRLNVLDQNGAFTDSVLKAVARRGQLKILYVRGSKVLTDDSIIYLLDRCKSLVSLDLFLCPRITERSLEAVVTEVRRRHGWPPRTLPVAGNDPGIFYFEWLSVAEITKHRVQELVGGDNPWLIATVVGP